MKNYGFHIFWSEEDEGYIATSPDFPGLSAFGENPEEALSEARIALELFVETYKAEKIPLPEPKDIKQYSGQFRLRISKDLHCKAAQAAARENVSLNQFVSNAIAIKLGMIDFQRIVLEQISGCLQEMKQVSQQYAAPLLRVEQNNFFVAHARSHRTVPEFFIEDISRPIATRSAREIVKMSDLVLGR